MRKLLLFLFLIPLYGLSQDIHFSQFNQFPLHQNPSTTGQFDGDYRFAGIQRTQWRSVTTNPFVTFGVSGETSQLAGREDLGLGIKILQDRAGDGEFYTFEFFGAMA